MEHPLKLEHAFDIRIDFDMREEYGPLPGGGVGGFTRVGSGTVSGPRLNGTLIPQGGADWATVRDDGVIDLDAHYMIEADDGTLIHIKNSGYLVRGAPGADGKPSQPSYFRITPRFRAPVGEHDWLSRTIFVGYGVRHWNPDHTIFHYFSI